MPMPIVSSMPPDGRDRRRSPPLVRPWLDGLRSLGIIVPVLARKPGALRNGAPSRTGCCRRRWSACGAKPKRHDDGDRQMVDILTAKARPTGWKPAVEAKLPRKRSPSASTPAATSILNILARQRGSHGPPATILNAGRADIALMIEPVADCARYDSLRENHLMERSQTLRRSWAKLKLYGMKASLRRDHGDRRQTPTRTSASIGDLLNADQATKQQHRSSTLNHLSYRGRQAAARSRTSMSFQYNGRVADQPDAQVQRPRRRWLHRPAAQRRAGRRHRARFIMLTCPCH